MCIYKADILSQNFNKSNVVKYDENINDIIHTIKVGEIKFNEDKIQK